MFAAKLPVSSIHAKGVAIKVEPVQNQPSKLFITVGVTGKKSFDSTIARLCFEKLQPLDKSCKSGFATKRA